MGFSRVAGIFERACVIRALIDAEKDVSLKS